MEGVPSQKAEAILAAVGVYYSERYWQPQSQSSIWQQILAAPIAIFNLVGQGKGADTSAILCIPGPLLNPKPSLEQVISDDVNLAQREGTRIGGRRLEDVFYLLRSGGTADI